MRRSLDSKNVITSISLPAEVFNDLQKLSRERGLAASALIAQLIKKTAQERNKMLAQHYEEAEKDSGRKEVIEDLKRLDDEGWPDE